MKVTERCRKHRISDATYYDKKARFGGWSDDQTLTLAAAMPEK